jgi:hypothetical protein
MTWMPEVEVSPLLQAVARERLLMPQQGAVVIRGLWGLAVAL